ncbi:HEPN domain-containing protein [Pedobacter sp. MR22-3]|uniref:HEPN domain-containing protein n=1 Tax=Pedobacter sp. MR22-3 TaxID=2994552 RepID=UPI0022471352|nr:HEPN domain-containing protein [Pedobacter sp. MR22-3]MCX2585938.1 HEPN domain-containing protein [Pedobacter sp. MR22-3]
MTTLLTVSEKTSFRYLQEKDIISPHYQIARFLCSQENSLVRLKSGVIELLKAAFTNVENADYFYLHQQLIKLLELSFVIRESDTSTTLDSIQVPPETDNQTIYNPLPTNNNLSEIYRSATRSNIEVSDSNTSLDAFFRFKSLSEWKGILDSLLYAANGKVLLTEILHIQAFEAILVREHLDKMIDAMWLVFLEQSMPYVRIHHADEPIFKDVTLNTAAPNINSHYLANFKERNFPAVISFLAEVIAPEKIFCLNHEPGEDGTDHANLILVIPDTHAQAFVDIETVFEFALMKHHRISCSLFKSSFFHKMITEGHIYFSMSCNPDSLVYDDCSKPMPKLKIDERPEKIEKTKQDFYTGMTKAKTFFTAALQYKCENRILSAFMLHQAAELSLRALNRSLTTQDKTTHNISSLLKFNLRLTTRLFSLMDDGSEEDERLLFILNGAYLGYRYHEKYNIEPTDLETLFGKVEKLHAGAEEIFLDWMAKYELLINTAQHD